MLIPKLLSSETYAITGVAKPRMTQADKWHKRPCVVKYWQYKALVRSLGITLPECGYHVIFYMPMLKKWGKKKKAEMYQRRHQLVPDKDNLEKGLLDAIFDDDKRVWNGLVTKLWAYEGTIRIDVYNGPLLIEERSNSL